MVAFPVQGQAAWSEQWCFLRVVNAKANRQSLALRFELAICARFVVVVVVDVGGNTAMLKVTLNTLCGDPVESDYIPSSIAGNGNVYNKKRSSPMQSRTCDKKKNSKAGKQARTAQFLGKQGGKKD